MFENIADAKGQILQDKHTLLEGYVTEYLFERQFLWGKIPYTSGWWYGETNGQSFFFVVSPQLNEVDWAVAQALSGCAVWRAYPQGDVWYFENGEVQMALPQFLAAHRLRTPGLSHLAELSVRDRGRQEKCISFFEAQGLLQKIAIERHFADFILADCFDRIVNIDYFTQERNGQLCAIEVKFKNETKNKTFGINFGQFHMFESLERLGFEIQHWILYKKAYNGKEVSIFDFLAQLGKKWWRMGALHAANAKGKNTAPKETSVYGSQQQGYYEFDEAGFKFIRPLEIDFELSEVCT